MPGKPPARPVRSARITAAVLPHAAFPAGEADTFPFAASAEADRLAWPVAAGVVLAVCAGLWLGIGSLMRLILA